MTAFLFCPCLKTAVLFPWTRLTLEVIIGLIYSSDTYFPRGGGGGGGGGGDKEEEKKRKRNGMGKRSCLFLDLTESNSRYVVIANGWAHVRVL